MDGRYKGDVAAEISSGHPEAYLDQIEQVYGDAFRRGTTDALETFYLLYQQFSAIGNATSTDRFVDRFLPMLPREARRKIINEIMPNAKPPSRDS